MTLNPMPGGTGPRRGDCMPWGITAWRFFMARIVMFVSATPYRYLSIWTPAPCSSWPLSSHTTTVQYTLVPNPLSPWPFQLEHVSQSTPWTAWTQMLSPVTAIAFMVVVMSVKFQSCSIIFLEGWKSANLKDWIQKGILCRFMWRTWWICWSWHGPQAVFMWILKINTFWQGFSTQLGS